MLTPLAGPKPKSSGRNKVESGGGNASTSTPSPLVPVTPLMTDGGQVLAVAGLDLGRKTLASDFAGVGRVPSSGEPPPRVGIWPCAENLWGAVLASGHFTTPGSALPGAHGGAIKLEIIGITTEDISVQLVDINLPCAAGTFDNFTALITDPLFDVSSWLDWIRRGSKFLWPKARTHFPPNSVARGGVVLAVQDFVEKDLHGGRPPVPLRLKGLQDVLCCAARMRARSAH